jgi:hypothetical protein
MSQEERNGEEEERHRGAAKMLPAVTPVPLLFLRRFTERGFAFTERC